MAGVGLQESCPRHCPEDRASGLTVGSGCSAGDSSFPWDMNCHAELSVLRPGSGLRFFAGTCCGSPGKRSEVGRGRGPRWRKQAGTPPRTGRAPQGTATCLKHTVTQAASQGCQGSHESWAGGGAGHPASSASGCLRHWQNRRRKPRNNAAGLTSGKSLVLTQKEGAKSGRLQRIRTGNAGKKMHVLFLKKERDWMK